MSAYISTDLNMVKKLDPQRHELALLQEAFLSKGGAIEVLQGPSFAPLPIRHEPSPRAKQARHSPQKIASGPEKVDKLTLRDIEREERRMLADKARSELVESVRKLAETMCYSQAILRTGISRKALHAMAIEHGFSFQQAGYRGTASQARGVIDEAHDAKLAERIMAFKEIGLTRNQAIGQCGITFKTFVRILDKFSIEYPKCSKGPHPAFFAKPAKS